jgi:hypothetical protein
MQPVEHIPMVRCRLDAPEEGGVAALRYIPLAEFDLWRYLMETRHKRNVTIEQVSIWISEHTASWAAGLAADSLEPVLRLRFERDGPQDSDVPVERFFPAETYPEARRALLSHFESALRARSVRATPGYFVVDGRRSAIVRPA